MPARGPGPSSGGSEVASSFLNPSIPDMLHILQNCRPRSRSISCEQEFRRGVGVNTALFRGRLATFYVVGRQKRGLTPRPRRAGIRWRRADPRSLCYLVFNCMDTAKRNLRRSFQRATLDEVVNAKDIVAI